MRVGWDIALVDSVMFESVVERLLIDAEGEDRCRDRSVRIYESDCSPSKFCRVGTGHKLSLSTRVHLGNYSGKGTRQVDKVCELHILRIQMQDSYVISVVMVTFLCQSLPHHLCQFCFRRGLVGIEVFKRGMLISTAVSVLVELAGSRPMIRKLLDGTLSVRFFNNR